MGRPRKPAAVKVLEGNRGKRPIPREARPTLALPAAPDHLSPDARAEWDRIAGQLAQLGLATGLDVAALACYCELYSAWIGAKRFLAQHGATYEVRGIWRKRPEVAIAEHSQKLMRPYLMEFGMSPRSRATVAAAIADGRQPMLPMDIPEKNNPAKPAMPAAPLDELSDEEFLNVARPQ